MARQSGSTGGPRSGPTQKSCAQKTFGHRNEIRRPRLDRREINSRHVPTGCSHGEALILARDGGRRAPEIGGAAASGGLSWVGRGAGNAKRAEGARRLCVSAPGTGGGPSALAGEPSSSRPVGLELAPGPAFLDVVPLAVTRSPSSASAVEAMASCDRAWRSASHHGFDPSWTARCLRRSARPRPGLLDG